MYGKKCSTCEKANKDDGDFCKFVSTVYYFVAAGVLFASFKINLSSFFVYICSAPFQWLICGCEIRENEHGYDFWRFNSRDGLPSIVHFNNII